MVSSYTVYTFIISIILQYALLSQVMRYTRDGWPDRLPTERLDLQPYFSRRNELSLDGDVLLWGIRVIIPKQFRAEILDELHTDHNYRCCEIEGGRTLVCLVARHGCRH